MFIARPSICLLKWSQGLRLFSDVWSENAALFKRLMKIHSNPPILYYGFKVENYWSKFKMILVSFAGHLWESSARLRLDGWHVQEHADRVREPMCDHQVSIFYSSFLSLVNQSVHFSVLKTKKLLKFNHDIW